MSRRRRLLFGPCIFDDDVSPLHYTTTIRRRRRRRIYTTSFTGLCSSWGEGGGGEAVLANKNRRSHESTFSQSISIHSVVRLRLSSFLRAGSSGGGGGSSSFSFLLLLPLFFPTSN